MANDLGINVAERIKAGDKVGPSIHFDVIAFGEIKDGVFVPVRMAKIAPQTVNSGERRTFQVEIKG